MCTAVLVVVQGFRVIQWIFVGGNYAYVPAIERFKVNHQAFYMLLPVVGVPRVQQHSNLAFSHRAQGSQLHSTDGRVLLHVMLPRFWREPNLAPCILCNGCVGQVVSLSVAMTNSKRNGAPYRHLLLYGPPGTGKTMVAKRLVRATNHCLGRLLSRSVLSQIS